MIAASKFIREWQGASEEAGGKISHIIYDPVPRPWLRHGGEEFRVEKPTASDKLDDWARPWILGFSFLPEKAGKKVPVLRHAVVASDYEVFRILWDFRPRAVTLVHAVMWSTETEKPLLAMAVQQSGPGYRLISQGFGQTPYRATRIELETIAVDMTRLGNAVPLAIGLEPPPRALALWRFLSSSAEMIIQEAN